MKNRRKTYQPKWSVKRGIERRQSWDEFRAIPDPIADMENSFLNKLTWIRLYTNNHDELFPLLCTFNFTFSFIFLVKTIRRRISISVRMLCFQTSMAASERRKQPENVKIISVFSAFPINRFFSIYDKKIACDFVWKLHSLNFFNPRKLLNTWNMNGRLIVLISRALEHMVIDPRNYSDILH